MKLLLKSILFGTGLMAILVTLTIGITQLAMYLEQFGIIYPVGVIVILIWIAFISAYYLGRKRNY